MTIMDSLKKHKLTVGATTLVGAALYGIAEYGSGGDSRSVSFAALVGGALGAMIGSAAIIGIGYSRGVGATPCTPIFAGLGLALPFVLELPSMAKGRRSTTNKELLSNSVIVGALGSSIGVSVDYYRGQM
jgi:hypothetical protein